MNQPFSKKLFRVLFIIVLAMLVYKNSGLLEGITEKQLGFSKYNNILGNVYWLFSLILIKCDQLLSHTVAAKLGGIKFLKLFLKHTPMLTLSLVSIKYLLPEFEGGLELNELAKWAKMVSLTVVLDYALEKFEHLGHVPFNINFSSVLKAVFNSFSKKIQKVPNLILNVMENHSTVLDRLIELLINNLENIYQNQAQELRMLKIQPILLNI